MILVDDRVLTPEQQEFAEQHHGLLLKFMSTYGLTDDDYGILAERYVKTVKKYLETESLHQYRFSKILWSLTSLKGPLIPQGLKRYMDLFKQVFGVDPNTCTDEDLRCIHLGEAS